MADFLNAPSQNTYDVAKNINGRTVIFEVKTQDQHIYPQSTFTSNTALQAMQREGLWHGNDFRVNGLQLPAEMRVKSIDGNAALGTTTFTPIQNFQYSDGVTSLRSFDLVPGTFHNGSHQP